jgi:hypothetical protein
MLQMATDEGVTTWRVIAYGGEREEEPTQAAWSVPDALLHPLRLSLACAW